MENINFIHNWCLFIAPDTTILLEAFNGIYSSKYSCGREMHLSPNDSERVMCSNEFSKQARNDSVIIYLLLSMRFRELKETGKLIFTCSKSTTETLEKGVK